ncbi:MAG: acyloxyacyl hydrolase [Planctomycetota bacterium]
MRVAVGILALALAGCRGGVHHRGEWQAIGDVSFGFPAGDFLFSAEGAGAPELGLRAGVGALVSDRTELLAMGVYRYYSPESGSLNAGEVQLGVRYFPPIDFHIGKAPVAPFLDAFGGVMHSSASFPVDGTATNATGEWGLGLEVILGERTSLFGGYHFRHVSNGGGNVPENPGYNDNQFFLGFGWRW